MSISFNQMMDILNAGETEEDVKLNNVFEQYEKFNHEFRNHLKEIDGLKVSMVLSYFISSICKFVLESEADTVEELSKDEAWTKELDHFFRLHYLPEESLERLVLFFEDEEIFWKSVSKTQKISVDFLSKYREFLDEDLLRENSNIDDLVKMFI
jgi:hypothetical protein